MHYHAITVDHMPLALTQITLRVERILAWLSLFPFCSMPSPSSRSPLVFLGWFFFPSHTLLFLY